ncbi:MAG: hypothetical protein ABW170_04095 [Candidatus Thiodiazotropha sp. L084R]
MNRLTITIAATILLTVVACGKSGETDSSSSGAPTAMTEQSQHSVAETGKDQGTIQSEQAAFEAVDSAGSSENAGSEVSGEK